jgi:hypothetical protein
MRRKEKQPYEVLLQSMFTDFVSFQNIRPFIMAQIHMKYIIHMYVYIRNSRHG